MKMDFSRIFKEMTSLYLNDKRPWLVGFSGGKDSTCVTQIVYYMLQNLPPNRRKKEVHIISSNTLVESPFIEMRIKRTLKKIEIQAKKDGLPIKVKILRPMLSDTFWVNLIGRGYPSPNRWFRWCTDRLKVRPITKYTLEQIKENGEVIILLGARKDESGSRAQTMGKYEIKDFRLRKHGDISGAYYYAPIEDWTFRDVWAYLLQAKSPWGDNNRDLITLYRKCDRECPLVIDANTPACGGSRFGCWVCTVVKRDRAIEGLIEDGETWLKPLLTFRNWLKEIRNDPKKRETIRKTDEKKKIVAQFFGKKFAAPEHRGHKILGPFTFETRHEILRQIIGLQEKFSNSSFSLISPEEIKAIETIWIYEGDNILSIGDVLNMKDDMYKEKSDFKEISKLNAICNKYNIPVDLLGRLLVVEKDFSSLSRRAGILNRLEKVIEEEIMQMAKSAR